MKIPDVWPIGIGAPCVGCTEKTVAFKVPIFEVADIHGATPPEALPLINTRVGTIGTAAAAMVGVIAGGIGGAALMASKRLPGQGAAQNATSEEEHETTGAGRS